MEDIQDNGKEEEQVIKHSNTDTRVMRKLSVRSCVFVECLGFLMHMLYRANYMISQ